MMSGGWIDLSGQRAVVTGGTKGVGGAVVAALVAAGAKIVTAARSVPETMPEGVPVVFILILLGSYQATRHMGDLVALLGFGVLGWLMKRAGMARPPLLVGFILAPLIERDLWVTTSRYGLEWLTRPGVMIIGAIIFVFLAVNVKRRFAGAAQ